MRRDTAGTESVFEIDRLKFESRMTKKISHRITRDLKDSLLFLAEKRAAEDEEK